MKSQRIAVAGGQGKIGRHIVEGLLEAKQRYPLEFIIVLSRSESPDITYVGSSAPVIAVDYNNQTSLQGVLEQHNIDTVISTISGHTPDAFITSQENLLQAALKVPSFRRFAPKQVAHKIKLYQMKLPIIHLLRRAKHRYQQHQRQQQHQQRQPPDSKLFEFSLINCGMFMNYLGYGNTMPGGHKAHGYLARFPMIFELSRRVADGYTGGMERDRSSTRTRRMWGEYLDMAGEVATMNEILRMCEDVCGTKFDVKYNSREDILARMSPAPEKFMENFFLEGYLASVNGDSDAMGIRML
ncbi:hypothetical protein F5876DRAFT_64650 [Lentinula aff. lateritia]|uniref:Uncharacterized protein n=1 Tax=Lentinula aff. lateritia TaxID=2804960 RepID=A0ACC1U3L0_9AGAR|nr:hypothetical protein F5876DRAFT_64650 [Lentinula aff. lateritia]